MASTLIVDGNNVMGSTPDGWWRDRPAAVLRLLGRVQCYARSVDDDVVLVLDVAQADVPEGDNDGVHVQYATHHGRNAADDRIRELVDDVAAGQAAVVTSDRELQADVVAKGARVVGARAFLDRLDEAGC